MKKIFFLVTIFLLFISTSTYAMNIEDAFSLKMANIVGDIEDNTSIITVKTLTDLEGSFYKDNNPVDDNEIISTGMIYKSPAGKDYILSVKGDTSGDGDVTGTDLIQAKNFIVGIGEPSDYIRAAICSNSNLEISATDVLKLKGYIVEEIDSLINARDLYISTDTINVDLSNLSNLSKIVARTIPATVKQNIVFESGNTNIVDVNNNGNISIKTKGNTTISIKDTINNFTKTCNVEVHSSPTSISFSENEVKLTSGDSTYQLNLRIEPSDADINNNITYSSSDSSVASVDSNGLVTILKRGDFIITATSEKGLSSSVNFLGAGFSIEGIPGQIANFFYGKGMPLVGIAALLGNAQIESSFNPTVVNEYNCAGLWQFNLNYFDLKGFASERGKDWTDAEVQMEFLWYKLTTEPTREHIYNQLMTGTDVEYVTWYFARHYEMPWTTSQKPDWNENGRQLAANRINAAKKWYNKMIEN